MREVYINGQQVDVNQEDAVDIIYESPIFSDISKIKSNTTTTYTLPKTDRNLAIFRHADQHDVNNTLGYAELKFEEYRSGLPIIQNGKCRLLKIADRIELAVVWGIKVALTEKLGMKLNEVKNNENVILGKNGLATPESQAKTALLVADFGQQAFKKSKDGNSELNFDYMHPSASVDFILRAIVEDAGVKLEIKGETSEMLKQKWMPCVSRQSDESTWLRTKTSVCPQMQLYQVAIFSKPEFDPFSLADYQDRFSIPVGDFKLIFNGSANYEGDKTAYKLCIDVTSHNGLDSITQSKRDASSIGKFVFDFTYDKTTNRSQTAIYIDAMLKSLNNDYSTDIYPRSRYHIIVYYVNKDGEFKGNANFNNMNLSYPNKLEGRLFIESRSYILPGTAFPVMKNLPDMTCIDFIKSICQMYALFPHYNFETSTLEFLQINNIADKDNIAKAKNWDDKILVETWTIERSFGDYAKRNRFRYQEDETVQTVSEGYMLLENQVLINEKDLVDLKFSASDTSGTTAHLPIYLTKDDGTIDDKLKTIKPRILSQGEIEVKEGKDRIKYKSLSFDESMKFEGEDGLLDTYYDRYKDVVEMPVLRDVVVLLSEVELMHLSTLDVIYLRGKYWMPLKIQVGIDGKAKARLMLLPQVFS